MKASTCAPRRERLSVLLCAVAFVLALLILVCPLLRTSSTLYTKRSPNTFVGDEKYVAARAEAEAMQADYAAQGIEPALSEEVVERVNNKGVTTSLVVFTVRAQAQRSLLSLLGAGLPSSFALAGLLLCMLLCAALAAASLSAVGTRRIQLRSVAVGLSIAAVLLVPLAAMRINLDFARSVSLLGAGRFAGNAEAFSARLGGFLFAGVGEAERASLLGSLSFSLSGLFWLLLLPALCQMLAALFLRKGELGRPLLRVLLYAVVISFSLFILYPFFVMFITAFRSNAETTDMYFQNILPTRWYFSNLGETLNRGVLRFLGNSLLIAGGATGIAMLCGIPAAYAMARMKFRGQKAFLGFVIMSQMFAPVVLLVGISRLMNTLHLNDSLLGLMLINAAFNQAFAIWLLRGTFVSISSEMEQAAWIDGCNTVQSLIRILLPMAAPGIVTTLIFIFINAWNEYTISTVLISTQTLRPITVGITQFSSYNMIEWQYLFAAALLATIPVVILFTLIEKHLAAGLTAGGVKG